MGVKTENNRKGITWLLARPLPAPPAIPTPWHAPRLITRRRCVGTLIIAPCTHAPLHAGSGRGRTHRWAPFHGQGKWVQAARSRAAPHNLTSPRALSERLLSMCDLFHTRAWVLRGTPACRQGRDSAGSWGCADRTVAIAAVCVPRPPSPNPLCRPFHVLDRTFRC